MPLPSSPPPSAPYTAQVIYPLAFHPHLAETPAQWAAEAVRQHLAAHGQTFDVMARGEWLRPLSAPIATPAEQLAVRFDHKPGQFDQVTFGAGLAFANPAAIVARLPEPPRSWLDRLLGGAQ